MAVTVMCTEFGLAASVPIQSPHFCFSIDELCPVSTVTCLTGKLSSQ